LKEDVANDPRLHLEADDIPTIDELEYEGSVDEGLWYAESDDGFVSYFAWDGGQQDGYGGRHYDITTVDGEEVTLKGPWSSRAGVMNKAGYGPCMDVRFNSTGTGAVTVDRAEDVVDEYLEDVELERVEKFSNNEPYWIPRRGENQQS
jgi:hypothetical protein